MEQTLLELYRFDYDEMQMVVTSLGLSVSAPEIHGYQTGLLVLNVRLDEQAWWTQFLTEYPCAEVNLIAPEDRQALYSLHLQSIEGLESNDFEFALLQPDDDASLILRVKTLADWCAGFLAGLQSAVILADPVVRQKFAGNEQVRELLSDISAIRHAEGLELSDVEDLLETERNYAEITEYVRVAVMTIYIEIALEVLDDAQAHPQTPSIH